MPTIQRDTSDSDQGIFSKGGKRFQYARKDDISDLVGDIEELAQYYSKEIRVGKKRMNVARINDDFLSELDELLEKYSRIFGSRNKLSDVLKHIGLCLTTGKQH